VLALRDALRDTQEQFAERVGCSADSVRKWEQRTRPTTPSAKYAECLDTILRGVRLDPEQLGRFRNSLEQHGHNDQQLQRFAAALGSHAAPTSLPDDAEPITSVARSNDLGELPFDLVERREFVRLMSLVAGQLATAVPERAAAVPGMAHDSPVKVDDQLIDEIESALADAMAQDDRYGPWLVLRSVLSQQNIVAGVLPDCPSRFRPRLMSVYANLTRFAGWLYFDLGDHASASKFYENARLAAHEAGDAELAAFTLSHMSHLAVWNGNPRLGVDHAEAALSWARRSCDPLLIADTAEMAARAYSQIPGEKSAALAALDENTQHAAEKPREGKSLAYFYGPGFAAAARSSCLRQLGDADRAEAAARESLALVGPAFVRARAFSLLELGNAHVRQREIEAAAAIFAEAAELATRNNSGRLVDSLRESRAMLTPWAAEHAVRELDQHLVAHGFMMGSSST
jgi:tetratricopeptide (TPR) repeat protein